MSNDIIRSESYVQRNHWLSFFLSLFCNGLGQLFNGEFAKAIVIFFAGFIILLSIPFMVMTNDVDNSFFLFVFTVLSAAILKIYAGLNAIFYAKNNKKIILNKSNTILFYSLFTLFSKIILIIGLYVLFSFVSFRIVKDNQMYPALKKGDLVLSLRVNSSKLLKSDIIITKEEKMLRIIADKSNSTFRFQNQNIFLDGKKLTKGVLTAKEIEKLGLENDERIYTERNGKRFYLISESKNRDNSLKKKREIAGILSQSRVLLVPDNREELNYEIASLDKLTWRIEGILYSKNLSRIAASLYFPYKDINKKED